MAKLDGIVADRAQYYGDFRLAHTQTGIIWAALLRLCQENRQLPGFEPAIPPDMVALMLTAMKLARAAAGKYREDNYDDARNYLRFAQELRRG